MEEKNMEVISPTLKKSTRRQLSLVKCFSILLYGFYLSRQIIPQT